jgi:hypothetical protein
MKSTTSPLAAGVIPKEFAAPMTVDTLPAETFTADFDTPDLLLAPAEPTVAEPAPVTEPEAATEAATEVKPKKVAAKKAPAKKAKTLELTLTVTGTADGEWRAELKQGSSYLARNLAVAAVAVSRAAKELHESLATPIDALIEEARAQQAAKVAALEAELEAAKKVLADLD